MEVTKQMKALEVGDTIKCHDPHELGELDQTLVDLGYETEFVYEMDGERGYWLEIIGKENAI